MELPGPVDTDPEVRHYLVRAPRPRMARITWRSNFKVPTWMPAACWKCLHPWASGIESPDNAAGGSEHENPALPVAGLGPVRRKLTNRSIVWAVAGARY